MGTFGTTIINDKGFPEEVRLESPTITDFLTTIFAIHGNKKITGVTISEPTLILNTITQTPPAAFAHDATLSELGSTSVVFTHESVSGAVAYAWQRINEGDGAQDGVWANYIYDDLPITIDGLNPASFYTLCILALSNSGVSMRSKTFTTAEE